MAAKINQPVKRLAVDARPKPPADMDIGRGLARFGVTVDAIMKANGITNANLIKVGQVLVIP